MGLLAAGIGVASHVVFGGLASALIFRGWAETWVLARPRDYIDSDISWWWMPFVAMGLLTSLLTVRRRDWRLFWTLVPLMFAMWFVAHGCLVNRLS